MKGTISSKFTTNRYPKRRSANGRAYSRERSLTALLAADILQYANPSSEHAALFRVGVSTEF
jgi:hypothetical protein